jgi:glutamine synthetase
MSVFIGTQLSAILDQLEKNIQAGKMTPQAKTDLKLSIGKIPQLLKDNTDRNRTSPFAFTGNKFEFRAVGSSANCASAMIALNTIMAKQLKEFSMAVDKRVASGEKRDEAVLKVLQQLIKDSKAIRFEGNGYGDEWVKEAEKRGLNNFKDTPRALEVLRRKDIKALFTEIEIFSDSELEARYEIELETYIRKVQIEARILGDMARNHIIPAVVRYQNTLLSNITQMLEVFGPKEGKELAKVQIELVRKISGHLDAVKTNVDAMIEERKKANVLKHAKDMAIAYCDKVKPWLDIIRQDVDDLEMLVDDELWPLPKMRELLFAK